MHLRTKVIDALQFLLRQNVLSQLDPARSILALGHYAALETERDLHHLHHEENLHEALASAPAGEPAD